ncbi:hypothetical protein, partial [Aquipseudomonas alcaligenes]|uniref:hypothetical protein n=1 Tax=Aquipseudomonas alcaligenes TaxID=43263 RepID=UPI001C7F4F6C
ALPTSLPISSAGGAFYSVQNRCQPPLSRAFDSGESKHRQSQTTALSARRILTESAADAIFCFVQLFDFQGASERTAPEEARIIRTLNGPSTAFGKYS